jgi:DNA-binding NtrC family response regulator
MSTSAFAQKDTEFVPLPRKVLLVDEDASDLKRYQLALAGRDFEIHTCSTYQAAIRSLETNRYDFVLVSQGSQAFEGRIVLDRAIEMDRHRAVLVVTRSAHMPCYLEAMQMGAIDYLEKPVAGTELLRFVRAHVERDRLGDRRIEK